MLGASLAGGERHAHAGEPGATDPAFVYTKPADRDYLRVVIEEALILGVGYVQYGATQSNQSDWDVGADWPGVRSKLIWGASSFDDNRFDTNWLTHPLAGFFYYAAARGNRLGVFPSFAIAFGASTLWEELGELHEHVAINDVIVTPLSALPLGESTLQMGSFLHRGRRTPLLVALGWLFAPFKSAHDALDGLTPVPAEEVDELGLPADVWHRFSIGAAGGVTAQQRGPRQADVRGSLRSELITLPGYRREGQRGSVFDSGEVTSLRFLLGESEGRVVDLAFGASVLPAGWFWQDVGVDAAGALRGGELVAALNVGAEYMHHDYDRDGRRSEDRIGLVSAGATVDGIIHAGAATLRTRIDLLGDFAGVDAYALPEYQRAHGDAGLTSVLRTRAYYHAYGTTVRPSLELTVGRFDAGGEARFDAFRAIDNVDVEGPLPGEVVPTDRRFSARAWVGVTPWRHLRFFTGVEGNERSGAVANVRASRSELSAQAGMELLF